MTAERVAGLLEDGRKDEAKKVQEDGGIDDADVVAALGNWSKVLRKAAAELRAIADHPFPEEQAYDADSFEARADGIDALAASL